MNIKKIDDIIKSKIYIQVAKNGEWDKAWKTTFDKESPTINEISNYLSENPERLAFELFFETSNGQRLLFGCYYSSIMKTSSMENFLKTVFEVTFSNKEKPSEYIRALSEKLTGSPSSFLCEKPDSVVLGILDFWRFYETCDLSSEGDNINKLQEKLNKYPWLILNKDNPALLELVWNKDLLNFIGTTVSNKDEPSELYKLNLETVSKMISEVTS